ncbi:MAG TPA: cyclic nucleotide-binding domain-containing protein [Actinomycetota bacterium]|nr:cyclic nucleotide-binding domain-containing protein [Actinomycetota bacterium]
MDAGTTQSSLAAVPLFSGVSAESLVQLAAIATSVETTPGQVLIQQGAAGSGLFVIEEGTVVVERPGRDEVELGPGEFFGELALLTDEGVRVARVRTKTAGRCVAVPRAAFVDLLHREPALAVSLLSVLAERLAASSA